jgi:phenylalanyl-tRNA synthetase beta subunit
MLITHLLESQDNMRRFVRGFNPHNFEVILVIIYEAISMLGAQSVKRIEKQKVKVDKKLQ